MGIPPTFPSLLGGGVQSSSLSEILKRQYEQESKYLSPLGQSQLMNNLGVEIEVEE